MLMLSFIMCSLCVLACCPSSTYLLSALLLCSIFNVTAAYHILHYQKVCVLRSSLPTVMDKKMHFKAELLRPKALCRIPSGGKVAELQPDIKVSLLQSNERLIIFKHLERWPTWGAKCCWLSVHVYSLGATAGVGQLRKAAASCLIGSGLQIKTD